MKKSVAVFLAMFAIGAAVGLAIRSASHDPYDDAATHVPAPTTTPMVDNAPPRDAAPPAAAHASHAEHSATPAREDEGKPVNTVCAICGMEVDPSLPTMEYKGKAIGFGCKVCLPKFKADPDRYGPAALSNQVVE